MYRVSHEGSANFRCLCLFMSSEILYVIVTCLNLSLLCSHVCCNLWHNVHTYLSFLLPEFTFCIGYAQASLFWKSTYVHSVAYMIFPNGRTTVFEESWYFTSCLRFPVADFIMSPYKQKSRQACGPPRNTILNSVWFACRNKVNRGPLQCNCDWLWVQNIVLW
jgi:hypothetical protein